MLRWLLLGTVVFVSGCGSRTDEGNSVRALPDDLPSAVRREVERLRTAGTDERAMGAIALGGLGEAGAVPYLLETLAGGGDWAPRAAAAEALGKLRAAEAAGPLAEILGKAEEDRTVRCRAAEALGRIGKPESVAPLTAALETGSTVVRYAAAKALGTLGDGRAVEPLRRTARMDADMGVRAAALAAVRKLEGKAGGMVSGQ